MLSLSLSVAIAGQDPVLPPAFLDSPTSITVWVPRALTPDEAVKEFSVSLKSEVLELRGIKPLGQPWREERPASPGRVVLAGSFQDELGGGEWDPNGQSSEMTEVKEGIFELTVRLPKGRYEYKIAVGGGWGENYGSGFVKDGSNIALIVPADDTTIKFVVDFKARTIRNSLDHPNEVKPPSQAVPPASIGSAVPKWSAYAIELASPLPPETVGQEITLTDSAGVIRPVEPRGFLDQEAFQYRGEDLGAVWTPSATTFKVWSPTSEKAETLLYDSQTGSETKVLPMVRAANGVWSVKEPGNLHGAYYRYRFTRGGRTWEAADIYGRAASPDLKRTMVANLASTNPINWPTAPNVNHADMTDAVLYELHVRDFTSQPESGVLPSWRGRYAGLGQTGLKSKAGNPVGLDHLKRLGVTDLHLLPIQSFEFTGYTWGYGTTLFNVPEESYSATPTQPLSVIREVKQMVQSVHQAGMRVVMDVVYNHTWPPDGEGSAFEMTVPHYYFRENERGQKLNESGVGNAMADERWMVRRFVRDSLTYWAREYKVDGFRFDLLGMHKPESVAEWVKAVRAVDPDSVIYGEPWTGGGPTNFGKGAQRGLGIAVFNDRFRGFMRGDTRSPQPGFMHGGPWDRAEFDQAFRGYVGPQDDPRAFASRPSESINYASAHDDLSLWDKASLAMPQADEKRRAASVRLALASTLLSQGVPFIEGGVEIGRTKGGDPNSYGSGDSVNQFDWVRADSYQSLAAYTKTLIQIRRRHPAFRLRTEEQIKSVISTWPVDRSEAMAVFEIQGGKVKDSWDRIILAFNNTAFSKGIDLPEGTWQVAVEGGRAKDGFLRKTMGRVEVAPFSVSVVWSQR